jgi:hypothetical protein
LVGVVATGGYLVEDRYQGWSRTVVDVVMLKLLGNEVAVIMK